MTLLSVLLLIGAYFLLSGAVCCLLMAVGLHFYGGDPLLLDGTALGSALDDRDRRAHIATAQSHTDAYVSAEREAMELDYLLSLPTVDPGDRWPR